MQRAKSSVAAAFAACMMFAALLQHPPDADAILEQLVDTYRPPDCQMTFWLFNYTNVEDFRETGAKLRVEEVGPFMHMCGTKHGTTFEPFMNPQARPGSRDEDAAWITSFNFPLASHMERMGAALAYQQQKPHRAKQDIDIVSFAEVMVMAQEASSHDVGLFAARTAKDLLFTNRDPVLKMLQPKNDKDDRKALDISFPIGMFLQYFMHDSNNTNDQHILRRAWAMDSTTMCKKPRQALPHSCSTPAPTTAPFNSSHRSMFPFMPYLLFSSPHFCDPKERKYAGHVRGLSCDRGRHLPTWTVHEPQAGGSCRTTQRLMVSAHLHDPKAALQHLEYGLQEPLLLPLGWAEETCWPAARQLSADEALQVRMAACRQLAQAGGRQQWGFHVLQVLGGLALLLSFLLPGLGNSSET